MYGRLAADAEIKETKNGEKEYATINIYTPVSKYKEGEGRKNDDVYYNLICVNEKELEKIKAMDLKKGDTINFIGSLSSDTYENKEGKKIVRPKYFIEFIDPQKGKEASLYKYMDDAIKEAIERFGFFLESKEEIKKEQAEKRESVSLQNKEPALDNEYLNFKEQNMKEMDIMPF